MSCNNCYNGCTEITSDKCVKYTGIDIPALGINNGDSALTVTNAIVEFLVPVLNGSGIKPNVPIENFCGLVLQYLPSCTACTGFTLNDILNALVHAACNLQEQVDIVNDTLDVLNADYTIPVGPAPDFIPCLSGVTASSDTHTIVQAIINKLCEVSSEFNLLVESLPDTYVAIDNVNDYIEAYLNDLPGQNLIKDKMVPYVAVPYFGALTGTGTPNFDLAGQGQGDWIQIYLCNGSNAAPDLRGRVLVGTTAMGGTASFNPAVDPGIAGNPTYNLNTTAGANTITLNSNQIPAHTHGAHSVADPHTHTILNAAAYQGDVIPNGGTGQYFQKETKTTEATTVVVNTTIDNNITTNTPHANIQPVHACHFIMYIPS